MFELSLINIRWYMLVENWLLVSIIVSIIRLLGYWDFDIPLFIMVNM